MQYATLQTEEGTQPAQPSVWSEGSEFEQDWDNYLRSYKDQWLRLTFWYCIWPGLVFGYSIVMSVWYGGWWNTSADEPYVPKMKDMHKYNPVMISLPAILATHMMLAAPMLIGIILQLVLAWLGKFDLHKTLGLFLVTLILGCVSLGTLSLQFCDIQPKRGVENSFFVAIGLGIMLFGARGVGAIAQGKHGVHMQYMAACVCLIFSPGYNRIASIGIRWFFQITMANYSQQCWSGSLWSTRGYLYTWSFALGSGYLACLWLFVLKLPFFKKYSGGFTYMILLSALLLCCLLQSLYTWHGSVVSKIQSGLDCTDESLSSWQNFSALLRNQTLYDLTKAYGLCAPSDPRDLPGASLAERFRLRMP